MAKKSASAAAAAAPAAAAVVLTLNQIVEATKATGFMYATKEAAHRFIAEGLAEINEAVPNPEVPGEFAVRATAEGIAKIGGGTASAPASTKPTFQRLQVEAPASKPRGGGGVTIYPFDELAAPQPNPNGGKPICDAFFVPATDAKPKPWESLQSAVSAATRRYATKVGEETFQRSNGSTGTRAKYEYTRKFKLSEYENNGVKGALVSRVQ